MRPTSLRDFLGSLLMSPGDLTGLAVLSARATVPPEAAEPVRGEAVGGRAAPPAVATPPRRVPI